MAAEVAASVASYEGELRVEALALALSAARDARIGFHEVRYVAERIVALSTVFEQQKFPAART